MTDPMLTFEDWLTMGIGFGYCSEPVCDTHDGVPMTKEEEASFNDGYDPCIPAVRLWNARWNAEGDPEPVLGDVGPVDGDGPGGGGPTALR